MSEVVAELIAERDTLQAFFDVFDPLVDEIKLHVSDDGLHARAVDPANVAMVDAELAAEACESFDAPGEVVMGVDIESVTDRLKVADAGDLVQVALDMETRMLDIDIGHISQSVGLIDPDNVRQEPDLPDLDLPNTVVLEGRDLAQAIDVLKVTAGDGGTAWLEQDPDANTLTFRTEGDTDDAEVVFDGERAIMMDVTEAAVSIYGIEFLSDLNSPMPASSEVRARIGDEFPVRLSWYDLDGHLDVEQMLAPRVNSE